MSTGLLGIEPLDRNEIETILNRARDFQPQDDHRFKRLDLLRGRMVVNLFYETSTRTLDASAGFACGCDVAPVAKVSE